MSIPAGHGNQPQIQVYKTCPHVGAVLHGLLWVEAQKIIVAYLADEVGKCLVVADAGQHPVRVLPAGSLLGRCRLIGVAYPPSGFDAEKYSHKLGTVDGTRTR